MDKVIAVVIPTFNRSTLTDRAVNSVVSSRPELVEIIVVDDCGNPPYRFEDAKNFHGIAVTVLRTPMNVGPGLARKVAVEHFRGDAVSFLDSDDVFESSWIDAGLDLILSVSPQNRSKIILAGVARNGTTVNRFCLEVLRRIPHPLKIYFSRVAMVMFNPFYTPTIIVPRGLCIFNKSLRYCEDYYMNTMAIFRAKRIVISGSFACSIARKPGSSGGLSEMKRRMFGGEMSVRFAMLNSKHVPIPYKLLVPIGMLYQILRASVKELVA